MEQGISRGGMLQDTIVFSPRDVDLARSPLRHSFQNPTFILGTLNPGFTRLPSGNLLMIVRIAEALRQSIDAESVLSIRWQAGGFVIDRHPLNAANTADPRKTMMVEHHYKTMVLTSLSWLLPVEFTPDGRKIVCVHYERAIIPSASYQEYGVEDARISVIDGAWYMTTCSVSAERQCTTLYTSDNGLDYKLRGIVLDHQNKDMLLFEGKVQGEFFALTRPVGELYFAYAPGSPFLPGPAIQLAHSTDAKFWKPFERPCIRPRRGSSSTMKIGGGAPPILTPGGWLVVYHGVELRGVVGMYRTFWALLDADDPSKILRLEDEQPLLEARPELSAHLDPLRYLTDVVYTTGIIDDGEAFLLASGEDDLACRVTRISKDRFQD